MGQLIGVTGTGTGVGKTVLTALLTIQLRSTSQRAIAMKPFCAGSWADSELLQAANEQERTLEQITPVYCEQGLAPLAALGDEQAKQAVKTAVDSIRKEQEATSILLLEGIGGAAVPISVNTTVGEVFQAVGAQQLVVGVNRLGVINEVLLTSRYLEALGGRRPGIILMEEKEADQSAESNAEVISQVLGHSRICKIPFLGETGSVGSELKQHQKKLTKTLVEILSWVSVRPVDGRSGELL